MLTSGSSEMVTTGLGLDVEVIWLEGLNMVELGEFIVELRDMWFTWLWCFGRELEMTLGLADGLGRVPLSTKS